FKRHTILPERKNRGTEEWGQTLISVLYEGRTLVL
ncbi:hypothetical protein LCGC14_2945540, partial [marine sediment metagenome]